MYNWFTLLYTWNEHNTVHMPIKIKKKNFLKASQQKSEILSHWQRVLAESDYKERVSDEISWGPLTPQELRTNNIPSWAQGKLSDLLCWHSTSRAIEGLAHTVSDCLAAQVGQQAPWVYCDLWDQRLLLFLLNSSFNSSDLALFNQKVSQPWTARLQGKVLPATWSKRRGGFVEGPGHPRGQVWGQVPGMYPFLPLEASTLACASIVHLPHSSTCA